MRFSAVTALCAAPLALAGSLQGDLVARGSLDSELTVRTNHAEVIANELSKSESSKGQKSVVQTSVTEVIIIWINQGGNAATQTIGTTSAIANAPAAIATHTVSALPPSLKVAG